MKKKLISIISLTLAAAIGLSACSSGSAGGTGTAAGKDTANPPQVNMPIPSGTTALP